MQGTQKRIVRRVDSWSVLKSKIHNYGTKKTIGSPFEVDRFENWLFPKAIPTHSQARYLADRYFNVPHGGKHLSRIYWCYRTPSAVTIGL